jgi:hypothetical protein
MNVAGGGGRGGSWAEATQPTKADEQGARPGQLVCTHKRHSLPAHAASSPEALLNTTWGRNSMPGFRAPRGRATPRYVQVLKSGVEYTTTEWLVVYTHASGNLLGKADPGGMAGPGRHPWCPTEPHEPRGQPTSRAIKASRATHALVHTGTHTGTLSAATPRATCHTYTHTHAHTQVHTQVHTRTHTLVHTHEHKLVHTHTHARTHTRTHALVHTPWYTHTHAQTHWYTSIHTRTHTRTGTHRYTYPHAHTHWYTLVHTHAHAHTGTHTRTHTHPHMT